MTKPFLCTFLVGIVLASSTYGNGASRVEGVVRGACPQHSDIISSQKGTSARLLCGLEEIFALDKSAEISWLKDCKPMNCKEDIFRISDVSEEDEGNYTCLIHFTFEGEKFNTSRTIQLKVTDDPALLEPRVIHPQNETIKVKPGVKAELHCKVFMGMNKDTVGETSVYWLVNDSLIELCKSKHLLKETYEDPRESGDIYGLSRLEIAEVRPEFFHIPFRCVILNGMTQDSGVAWLIPADDREHYRVIFLCAAVPLIAAMAMMYHCFKVDVVLTYRSLLPYISSKKKQDGKVYDAYVSCLHSEALWSSQLDNFCLQVLPEVLEHRHGYSLFIRGRDDLPGEAAQSVISEAVRRSRRLIIVVSAPNKSALDPEIQVLQGVTLDADREGDSSQPDYEHQLGLYDALVESRLRVILVELGKNVDYSLLPESIRYLKQKQGALKWSPSNGDSTVTLNHRFWKYLRYHMPHRPKANSSTSSQA